MLKWPTLWENKHVSRMAKQQFCLSTDNFLFGLVVGTQAVTKPNQQLSSTHALQYSTLKEQELYCVDLQVVHFLVR